jgi:hypothetical protein
LMSGADNAGVRVICTLLFVCGGLAAGHTTPAMAVVSQFGSEGEGAGQFSTPTGAAVDQESGDVYLVDRENNRVEKFGAEGEFMLAWGGGVADGSSEALQTCMATCFKGVPGAGAGQFGERPGGVAVDNSLGLSRGDVYVEDRENSRIAKFSASGEFLLMFGGEVNATTHGNVCLASEACQAGVAGSGPGQFASLSPRTIAVDPAGTVYVGDNGRVQEFSPGGVLEGQISLPGSGSIAAVAVDSSKDVYVLSTEPELSGVRKYDGAGTELGEPRDPAANAFATVVAVGPSDELFVYDSESHHILGYDATGNQISSFVEDGIVGFNGGSTGMAFGDAIKQLYVLYPPVVRLTSPPPPGPVVTAGSESATELTPTGATLNAVINPEGPQETRYHFEYGTTASYGTSTPSEVLTSGSFEDQPVGAGITTLQPRTVYHFRVVATNAADETSAGPDETFTTLPPALINSESALQVTSTSARLAAELNPLGSPTEYRFEYGLSPSYETSVPMPDGNAGAGTADVALNVLLEGLQPGTTYHYRVTAHNSLGTVEGPDRTFSTQAGETAGLPDGRAWELVSPIDKKGVSLEAITEEGGVIQAAEEGSAVAYIAKGPIDAEPAGNRSIADTQLLATRGADAWSTKDIATPHEGIAGLIPGLLSEYKLFSSDVSAGLVEPEGATPLSSQTTERTPYRRDASGEYLPLVTASNVPPGTKFGGVETGPEQFHNGDGVQLVTATPDLSHVVLASPQVLTRDFAPGFESAGRESLYEWSGGALALSSVLPDGTPSAEQGDRSHLGHGDRNVRHAIADDGSRVTFETENESEGPHLYMRDMSRSETLQLDAPQAGAKGGAGKPVFQLASSDGTRVLFTDGARLTADATADASHPDMYLCDVGIAAGHLACGLRDLTVDRNSGETADVLGAVLGSDDEGRRVYYVANGALATGATHGDCVARISEALPPADHSCNLYAYDVSTGENRLVAILSNRDDLDWSAGPNSNASNDLGELTSRVSANGRFLAFMSQRSVTGYDNLDANSAQPDEEVYVYDATTGTLRCASCDRSGARPVGAFDSGEFPGLLVDRPRLWRGQWLAGSIPGWTKVDKSHALYQSRYLSDSGRLFFNSADALVPTDGNGTEDVYEYEPNGVGSCGREGGCQSLMSAGVSGEESAFLDASSTGDDLFLLTAAKLSTGDVDRAFDVYDAHVCTTVLPCPSAAASSPPACDGADACRGAPSGQQGAGVAPASQTFNGAGNLTPAPMVKAPTRAQKLARALQLCRKKAKRMRGKKASRSRGMCERRARRLYGPAHSAKAREKARPRKKEKRK